MAFGSFSAGTVHLDVQPDLSRFGSNLDRSLTSSRSRFQGMGKKMGLALGAGVAAGLVAIGKVAVDSIAAAQEAIEAEAQTAAVLKSTGGAANVTEKQIAKLSTTIMGYSAISDETIRSGANMLLTFTNIRNEVGKGNDIFNQATATISDMSVALDQDMKSSAIQLGKALNDPIKGITALSRVGVSFTEKQKEQITTLVESGDVMGAQKVILAELTEEFGGSAKAVGDTKPWEKFKLAVGEVQESIGRALLPIIGKLATQLAHFVQSDEFQKWLKDLTAWLKENVPKAIATAMAAFDFIKRNAKELAGVLGGALAIAIGVKVVRAFQALKLAMMTNPFILITAAVIALALLIITNWDKIKRVTLAVFDAVKDFMTRAWRNIKNTVADIVGGMLAFLVRSFASFLRFWINIAGGIIDTAAKAFGWVPGIGDKIRGFQDQFHRTTEKILRDLERQAAKFDGWGDKAAGDILRVAGEWRNLRELMSGPIKAGVIHGVGKFAPGGGIGTGTPGGSSLVSIGRWLQASGFRVAGHPAFPPIGGHTQGSYHYIGRAIDVNWGTGGPAEFGALQSVAAKVGSLFSGRVLESLGPWNDAAHAGSNQHWHLAMDRGGIVKGPAMIHQGNITEAHIPLTGPGAVGMKIVGTLNTPFGPAEMEATVVDMLSDGEIIDRAIYRKVLRLGG